MFNGTASNLYRYGNVNAQWTSSTVPHSCVNATALECSIDLSDSTVRVYGYLWDGTTKSNYFPYSADKEAHFYM